MPYQPYSHLTGQFYHVFNRGIDHRQTFTDKVDNVRAIQTLAYYRFADTPIRLSHYLAQRPTQLRLHEAARPYRPQVEILAYCLMSNHYHLLLRQLVDGGISRFISQFQNSYTRYFNSRHQRVGPLFLDKCRSIGITSETQLLHTSRYIHLNPFTAGVSKTLVDLCDYPYSSFRHYLLPQTGDFTETSILMRSFATPAHYQAFVLDQADYQRQLGRLKTSRVAHPSMVTD